MTSDQAANSFPMLVETLGLTKQYGALTALNDCSLHVVEGEILGLLGPNGAGKTTLIRLLLGFLRPTRGSATVMGLDCVRQSVQVRKEVSYLPAEARMFRQLRASDVLEFFSNVRSNGSYRRGEQIAQRLELDLTRRVAFMSTGMRQKLAMVAVMSSSTKLLIMDEPTSNLDPTVRGVVSELIREARDAGRTVLLSSHVLSEVEELCDRVVIMRAGQPVHVQTLADLRKQHRIRAVLDGPLPTAPASLAPQLTIYHDGRDLSIESAQDLTLLLDWLSTVPLRELRIEPIGLRAVYDRFHSETKTA